LSYLGVVREMIRVAAGLRKTLFRPGSVAANVALLAP